MKCPTCPESVLVITDRSGIEIDYCPNCRGVWLDRGELDKIVERSSGPVALPSERSERRRDDDWDDDRPRHKKRKRSSLLEELFDF